MHIYICFFIYIKDVMVRLENLTCMFITEVEKFWHRKYRVFPW